MQARGKSWIRSDDELLQSLSDLLSRSRRIEADLVARIAEVDERKLYTGQAGSSTFGECTEVRHLSEHETYVRIAAARASRKSPLLLDMLRGRSPSPLRRRQARAAPDDENAEELLARACHKSKRQIEELLAEISPRPDYPPLLRKL